MEINEAISLEPGTELEFNDEFMNKPHALNWTGQRKFRLVRIHKDRTKFIVTRDNIKTNYTYHIKYMRKTK